MRKTSSLLIFAVIIIFLLASYYFVSKTKNQNQSKELEITPTDSQMVGGDTDEYGCIPSAGYSWCEAKNKCLRVWEEPCVDPDNPEDLTAIADQIKIAIVEKHGESANDLDITINRIEGNYAQGGASQEGLGGGMWFAAKIEDNWELVWDGNGIIKCTDLSGYPQFPESLIPQCFDENSNELIDR